MFRTATATPTTATRRWGHNPDSAWREFGDRDANQDRIAPDLTGALNEPGF
ncbi:hypothetical protein [Pseudonocardia xishanensis]|uniref:Uncharacterized protein n=1 Tax=Pseudonocardia xishanensis TaxID=630995 RepID=A0ABP8RTY9_9PSEU